MRRNLALALLALAAAACSTKAGPDQHPPANPTGPAFTVVALGDSYAAGQGAPNERFKWWMPWSQERPTWEQRRCNRSRYAPTSQVVERLRQAGRIVRLHSYTCSGADIENGLLQGYAGQEPEPSPPLLDPQLQALEDRDAEPGGVQAATLSIGGNDIWFARVIASCLISKECEVIDPAIDAKLAALPAKLATLAGRLNGVFPGEPWRVLLTEYPDPAQASDGSPCNRRPRWDALGRIDAAESAWAESVVKKLNHRLCTAAHLHGWTWVAGPAAAYEKHGWCASDNWINTAGESSAMQRTIFGTLHPNQAGHHVTADALEAPLTALVDGSLPVSAACVAP